MKTASELYCPPPSEGIAIREMILLFLAQRHTCVGGQILPPALLKGKANADSIQYHRTRPPM